MLNTTNFEFYIKEFSNFLLLEKNLSSNTINSYQKDILQLENYISTKYKQNINIKDALSKDVFDEYLVYLYDKEYNSATLARKLSSIKSNNSSTVDSYPFAANSSS